MTDRAGKFIYTVSLREKKHAPHIKASTITTTRCAQMASRKIDAGVDYSRALIGPCSGCNRHECETCNPHAQCMEDNADLQDENEVQGELIAELRAEIARLKGGKRPRPPSEQRPRPPSEQRPRPPSEQSEEQSEEEYRRNLRDPGYHAFKRKMNEERRADAF